MSKLNLRLRQKLQIGFFICFLYLSLFFLFRPSQTNAQENPDLNGDGYVNQLDIYILLSLWGSGSTLADLDSNGIVNSLDFANILINLGDVPENRLPWGAFYASINQTSQYGMSGVITSSHRSLDSFLPDARASGVKVIVTLGSFAECNYYLTPTVFDYSRAFTDTSNAIDNIFSQLSQSQIQSYVNDGTFAALRIFDEVHYAGSCNDSYGIDYQLTWCDGGRLLKGLPIGTDQQPGFADLLHELKKRLPDNLPIGSTSQPSYMALVAERMNLLRQREGLSPLAQNSILAYAGYSRHKYAPKTPRQKFECDTIGYDNVELLFFLANRTCQYESDNYDWWWDYKNGCTADRVDFYCSWSWTQGSAGSFQSRIEDLANGGVSNGVETITLQDVQNSCNRLLP